MKTTADEVMKMFSAVLTHDVASKLDPTKPMVGQGVDSLALTALAVGIQNNFNIQISPEEGIKLKTVNYVVDFINKFGE